MRTLLLLAAVGVATAAPVPKGIKKAAPPPLDGRWRMVEAVYDGKVQDVTRSSDWYFVGERFALGNRPGSDANSGLKLIRDEKNPAHVEYLSAGDRVANRRLGLVEVSADEMKFCYSEPGSPRPAEMAPGPGLTYRVFKRVEEK